jgi:hypothetical protein
MIELLPPWKFSDRLHGKPLPGDREIPVVEEALLIKN